MQMKSRVPILIGLAIMTVSVMAQQNEVVYPTAILSFQERGIGAKGMGGKVSDLLFAHLSQEGDVYLIDRENMGEILQEQGLSLSGMVNPSQAVQVGQLTGAKLLITGSVIEEGKTLYLVAKIIGTETSKLSGQSVKGSARDGLTPLVEQLSQKINTFIANEGNTLVAAPKTPENQTAHLNKILGDLPRPSVLLSITEEHVGSIQPAIDPPAETELTMLLTKTGFSVVDPEEGEKKQAELLVQGEGFSEFGTRRDGMVSVKARLEIKVVDPVAGKTIVADRQTAIAIDLSEQLAGKEALQKAASELANRLLPQMSKYWKSKSE